ncbi:MAG: SGNH/GDSL hydrolase family protein [Tepidisphaerales bacterium]
MNNRASRIAFRAILAALLACAPLVRAQPAFPPPKNFGDPAKLGLGIQRAMTLLATSTPEHRNTVRVLFYGQSITEQEWWKPVADDLRHRFPNANLIIENRSLGGYASQLLVKSAETDLYPFQPDLLIFYVYGSHIEYENIIRRTRERTAADILIQTDHVNDDANLSELTDPARIPGPDGKIWNSFMNYKFLPEMVSKYHLGVVDQRNLWKQYLQDNKLPAKQLLRDGVHLNAHGNYLMAELVKASLVRRADVTLDPMNCDVVKTQAVGRDINWKDGRLTVPFDGNRIDIVVKPGPAGAPAEVRIDGKRPSEFTELYGVTRALSKPGGKWPPVMLISAAKLPLVEEWTMQVVRDPAREKTYTFAVTGSKTGPDGQGRSDARFVSNSGRVVVPSEGWGVEFALEVLAGIKPVPPTFTVKWQTIPQFVDTFVSPGVKDPAIETTVTPAQGLTNGKHTLEITGPESTPIAAIRIYRPPLQPAR